MKLLSPQLPLLITISLSVISCVWMKPAQERIDESRDKVTNQFKKELYRQQNKTNQGVLDITWKQGLNKMYLSNPELIQADFRIADAKDNQKQIWRNMIPSLSLGASDSFYISEVGDALSDTTLRINSYLALGNLLSLPTNIYELKLTYAGTELNAENTMRQQVIALYRLFQKQRLLKLQKKAIDIEGELVSGVTGLEGSEIISMKLQHKEALEAWKEDEKTWKEQVGDFYMTGFDSINLRESGIPDIIYKARDLNFEDTERWGLLQLNLLALEDIAERGRFLEVYLRYLPRANFSVSAPPLYSNSSSTTFDPSLIRVSPYLSWSLDSRGSIGRQLDRLKRDSPLKAWRNDKRQREEVKKLLEGKQALADIQAELAKLKNVINTYKDIVGSGLVEDPEKAIQTMRNLREKQVRLTAKEIEICSAFWLIDEKRWKPITKKWLSTRKDRTNMRKSTQKTNLKSLLKN